MGLGDAGLGGVWPGESGFVAVGTGRGCSGTDPPEVNGPLDSFSGMFMSEVWSDKADKWKLEIDVVLVRGQTPCLSFFGSAGGILMFEDSCSVLSQEVDS